MSILVLNGGRRLQGALRLHGAKNSVLPMLAAVYVIDGQSVLHNCPELTDVRLACEILRELGCSVTTAHGSIVVNTTGACGTVIPSRYMRQMRASIVFLGAVLARCGRVMLCAPGGCNLGPRPIDLHLYALRQMGARIEEADGMLLCTAPNGLHGCTVQFPSVSVGATENALIAAVTARGKTEILNAACEPEVSDVAHYLQSCGARIDGIGTDRLVVEGVPRLCGTEHHIIPDRIEAATYLTAAAVTGGDILLKNAKAAHLRPVLQRLYESGCTIRCTADRIRLYAPDRLRAFSNVRTAPYPFFPTDAQAVLMTAATVARGETFFEETVFSDRFRHATELARMGANIRVCGQTAVVRGVTLLHGATVQATDLRGGAALVLAGLCAEGQTEILNVRHIDRGYDKMECALAQLGADIRREYTWPQREERKTPMCPATV